MDNKLKTTLAVLAGMGVVTFSVIAANSLYTNNKIGVDKKSLAVSTIVAFGIGFLAVNFFINEKN